MLRSGTTLSKGAGESFPHFLKRLCTEGHTFFDAWLLAAGCIGQVGSRRHIDACLRVLCEQLGVVV